MTGWLEVNDLLGLVAGTSYWLDGMRSKELAHAAVRRDCDDAVVLTRVRLKRLPSGTLAFRHEYRFEFSMNGVVRQHGSVIVYGQRVMQLVPDLGDVPRLH